MQNYCKTIVALAAASTLVAGNAKAEVEYELHTGYSSEYLYRGVKVGNDLVEAGADVKGKAAGLDLSAGAWYGTFDGTDDISGVRGGNNVNELDLYGDVSKDFGFLTGSIGYIFRNYDQGNLLGTEDTQEIYFGISRDFGCVAASLTYYWGVGSTSPEVGVTEGYTEFALSHSFELSPCLALNVSTNVGYLSEDDRFTAWTTKVALDWGFAEHAKLSPFIAASLAMGEADRTIWYTTSNQFVGGAMLSVNF